jgi:hypothetical protein
VLILNGLRWALSIESQRLEVVLLGIESCHAGGIGGKKSGSRAAALQMELSTREGVARGARVVKEFWSEGSSEQVKTGSIRPKVAGLAGQYIQKGK